jgi:hypothetical protein
MHGIDAEGLRGAILVGCQRRLSSTLRQHPIITSGRCHPFDNFNWIEMLVVAEMGVAYPITSTVSFGGLSAPLG